MWVSVCEFASECMAAKSKLHIVTINFHFVFLYRLDFSSNFVSFEAFVFQLSNRKSTVCGAFFVLNESEKETYLNRFDVFWMCRWVRAAATVFEHNTWLQCAKPSCMILQTHKYYRYLGLRTRIEPQSLVYISFSLSILLYFHYNVPGFFVARGWCLSGFSFTSPNLTHTCANRDKRKFWNNGNEEKVPTRHKIATILQDREIPTVVVVVVFF